MNPSPLPPLRDVIAEYGLGANKALGQHFLLDLNITRKIARLAKVSGDDHVLEIGPGPGGLTRALLETGATVTAVERDARCGPLLSDVSAAFDGRLTVIEEDALQIREQEFVSGPVKIISNLPYNISTELLIKWLKQNHQAPKENSCAPLWSAMALMFQKEVADRILANQNDKAYGRLSIIAQTAAQPSRGFDLPARAFTPPPKVDSTVVLFTPVDDRRDLETLEIVTQAAFSQRRKMLRSSLKPIFGANTEENLRACGVVPTQRAEEVSIEQFNALAALYAENRS